VPTMINGGASGACQGMILGGAGKAAANVESALCYVATSARYVEIK